MRIGIDAKWYYDGPVSGKVVLQNLIKYLVDLDEEHEWVIFLDSKFKNHIFPLKKENVKICYVWSSINALSNIFILPFYAKKYQLDVVLFKFFVTPFFNFKKICFLYDNLFDDYPQFFSKSERLYFYFIKFFLKYSDTIIVNTQYVKDRLIFHKYTHQHSKITVIPFAVDTIFKPSSLLLQKDLETFKIKYKLPTKYILFVGRLNVRKNIESLIRSLPYIVDKSIPIIIIGNLDGVQSKIKLLLQDSQIKDRVYIYNNIKIEELIYFYASANIFCFPSHAEGFGLPPLEAMASGIPTAVSNTTCIPEVCGDAACYFNPNSPQDIASAINLLIENPLLYNQTAKLGLQRASIFNWVKFAKELKGLINNIDLSNTKK